MSVQGGVKDWSGGRVFGSHKAVSVARRFYLSYSLGMQYNFNKQKSTNIDSMSVPYDYESVMHYGKTAFGRRKLTIETIDKSKQNVIGRRSGFSQLDILQMNLLYRCAGRGFKLVHL